jgi:hypothetical protein
MNSEGFAYHAFALFGVVDKTTVAHSIWRALQQKAES